MKITYLIKNLDNQEVKQEELPEHYFICSTQKLEVNHNIVLDNNSCLADFYNLCYKKSKNDTDFYFIKDLSSNIDRNIEEDITKIKEEVQGLYWNYLAGEDIVYEEPYSRQRLTEIYWFPKYFLISNKSWINFNRNVSPAEEYDFLIQFTDKYMIKNIPYVIGSASLDKQDLDKRKKWQKVINYRLTHGYNHTSG